MFPSSKQKRKEKKVRQMEKGREEGKKEENTLNKKKIHLNFTKPLLIGLRIFHLMNKIPINKDLVPVRIDNSGQ